MHSLSAQVWKNSLLVMCDHQGVLALQMVTILFYLSDVEEGGDTIFPLEGRYGQERLKGTGFNYKSCEGGYRVCMWPCSPQSLPSTA